MKIKLKNIIDFLQEDIWVKDISVMRFPMRILFSCIRIVMIVIKGFAQDNCKLQASALTYITLVSLVPILAIMFSFTKGLGMQNRLFASVGVEKYEIVDKATGENRYEYRIISSKPASPADSTADRKKENGGMPPAEGNNENNNDDRPITAEIAGRLPLPMQEAMIKIFQYVDNTNFTALGLIGSIMLFISVICSMSKLEQSFNLIWGVKHPRNLLRKFSEYLVVLILIPVIFLFATSLNSVLFSQKIIIYLQGNYGQVAYLISILVKLTSLLILLASFGLFFMFMPNTRVKIVPAFIAGTVSFILWIAVQWAYLSLQVGLTNFNTIYGTFAVVPFFLAWLYANWSIVLFGGELCFAIQNHRTIHLEKTAEHLGAGASIAIGQLLVFQVCQNFYSGKGPTLLSDFCIEKSIPARSMRYVVDTLEKNGILVRTASDTMSDTYLPGKDISILSPADVEEAFRQQKSVETRSYIRDLPQTLRNEYETIYGTYNSSLQNITFYKFMDKTTGK